MNNVTQTKIRGNEQEDEFQGWKKSTFFALVIHGLFVFFQISAPPLVEEPKEEPITVNLVSFPEVMKKKSVVEVKPRPTEIVKPVEQAKPVPMVNKIVEKTEVASADINMPNARPAPERLNPHHTSSTPASPKKVAQTKHPGPEVTNDGPETAKFRAKNDADKVALDSTGPGGAGKVGGATGGGPEKGTTETYKGFNFKSAVNGLMAKGSGSSSGGGRNGTGNGGYGFKDGSQYGSGIEKIVGSSDGSGPVLSKISGNGVGKLTDAATGKIDGEVGAAGLVSKKGIMTASLPAGGTEVLGGMDPDGIRRALQEALPQFRSCYQKELDQSFDQTEGSLVLHFFISWNGKVTKSDVKGRTLANVNVDNCVLNVLAGIQFPKPPRSDSLVEVDQPLNFYAKKI